MTIAYKGTAYHGFQVQSNAHTVCEAFQKATQKVIGIKEDIKPCSRTDTGVHANGFCISMKTISKIPCDKLIYALNMNLPKDIAIKSCREVDENFHARYSASGKRYIYKVYNHPVKNPFYTDLAYHYKYPVDWDIVKTACKDLVGTHDFSAFCSTGGKVVDKVRTIYRLDISYDRDLVIIAVEGDGFLYNMVRIIVGTLLDIGAGRRPANCIPQIIESKDRKKAGKTAPPDGLYLDRVFYD
ncbi:MAG: tRNA pseudouridine(38-40) synthase TruA [Oscillospiraceae bacterium]